MLGRRNRNRPAQEPGTKRKQPDPGQVFRPVIWYRLQLAQKKIKELAHYRRMVDYKEPGPDRSGDLVSGPADDLEPGTRSGQEIKRDFPGPVIARK